MDTHWKIDHIKTFLDHFKHERVIKKNIERYIAIVWYRTNNQYRML